MPQSQTTALPRPQEEEETDKSLAIVKALAIVSRHLLKSMWAGNLYLSPFEITERIRESVIIFKLPVTI